LFAFGKLSRDVSFLILTPEDLVKIRHGALLVEVLQEPEAE
jgi:hypothetical protein